mgnify:CR=1 FL=1
MAIHFTDENFNEEVLASNIPVVVDFYADWCGPCKVMAPIIDEIADERPDITVGKVNVDENQELANQYRIMTIPTLIIFKNGTIVNQISGLRPKEDILELLQ